MRRSHATARGWALIFLFVCPLVILGIISCRSGGDAKVTVVATTPIIADLARAVAGERVAVISLIPAGADPHTFEVGPSVVRQVAQARLILANGLGLEGQLLQAVMANKRPDALLVLLGERLAPNATDPHLWLDPTMASGYVREMARALAEVDPEGASFYQQREQALQERLQALDRFLWEQVAAVPPENRELVATHAAFHWLAQRYGLREVGYLVTGPEEEPGAGALATLRERILAQGVPAVFVEPQLEAEDRVLASLASDLGLPVCTLYSDAFTKEVSSYLAMMEFNGRELRRCLGGGR
jgi:zinc/manganese transport system substrate-binding protein/zinc transport system substrate-binding protein